MSRAARRNWTMMLTHEDGGVMERLTLARTEDEAESNAEEYLTSNRYDPHQWQVEVQPLHEAPADIV